MVFKKQKVNVNKSGDTVFQYLKVGYKEDKGSLFTRSHM